MYPLEASIQLWHITYIQMESHIGKFSINEKNIIDL